MKKLILIFIVGLLASCDMIDSNSKSQAEATNSDESKITKEFARVGRLQGVFLFIESTPAKDYETLGKVSNEPVVDQIEASNKNKKPLRAGLDMLTTAFKNLSYNEKLNMLVENAKTQYKEDVQGIIVRDNLMSCEAIKFKEQ